MENTVNDDDKKQEPIVSSLFCASDADLVLYSSDRVEFRVFSRILVESSPVFHDMVSIPKPPETQGVVNAVHLDEDGKTLELLLQFIYPMPDPSVSTLEILKPLMKAADKYILEGATHSLKRILVSPTFMDDDPLRVYAIACMYGHEAEAKIASRHCLKVDILQLAHRHEELGLISGKDLLRLIRLQQTRAGEILSILNRSAPTTCNCHGGTTMGGSIWWWTEFKARAKEEIRIRPLTDAILQPMFLASCVMHAVSAGCPQCPTNYLSTGTQARLAQIKGLVDALPDTV